MTDEQITDSVDELMESEKYDEALALLKGQKEATPTILNLLGELLWILDQRKEAQENFVSATQLFPYSEKLSCSLFKVLYTQDHREDAFNEWRRFIRIGGKFKLYNELLRNIEEDEYVMRLVDYYGDDVIE